MVKSPCIILKNTFFKCRVKIVVKKTHLSQRFPLFKGFPLR
ncbi:hypothetical protein HMPREF1427_00301 [Helicobacter pylori GAM83Bi]|nr:hypothetical protein HMPREF1427_00301 [Helicobacter pylori GAM83Bi]